MRKIFLLSLLFFSCGISLSAQNFLLDHKTGKPVRYSAEKTDTRKVFMPGRYIKKPGEFRGVWIATAWNLDFPKCTSAAEFQKQYLLLLQRLKRAGINAVIFQVRPQCDAFYSSAMNPWSAFLRGGEGSGIAGFDPLRFMVSEAHKNGMQFHAWLNPYRVRGSMPSGKAGLKGLSEKSFARRNPDAVLAVPNGKSYILMLDPGNPKVPAHLLNTVKEIIVKYDVDGIHFDDYFYPYTGIGNADAATYRKYNRNRLPLAQWRRNNVDILIFHVSSLIHQYNRVNRKNIQFGISPFGIWMNHKNNPAGSLTHGHESYAGLYADSRRWIREGWIDYIAPQLYWSFTDSHAPFACVADWWTFQVRGTRVKLYPGLVINKFAPGKPFWDAPNELRNQLIYLSARQEVKGCIFYSGKALIQPPNALVRKNVESALSLWRGK